MAVVAYRNFGLVATAGIAASIVVSPFVLGWYVCCRLSNSPWHMLVYDNNVAMKLTLVVHWLMIWQFVLTFKYSNCTIMAPQVLLFITFRPPLAFAACAETNKRNELLIINITTWVNGENCK